MPPLSESPWDLLNQILCLFFMPMAHSLSFPRSSLQVLLCTVVGMYLVIIFLSSLPLSDSSLLAGVRRAGQGLELGLFPKSEDAK